MKFWSLTTFPYTLTLCRFRVQLGQLRHVYFRPCDDHSLMLACLKFILLFISLFPQISTGSSSCRLPVMWCGLSITSLLRAVHFPVNWSRNASVSITYHCTKRVNWTTQPRNTFLVTWWNRREHFTWVWWLAVITLVRACTVKTEELVLAVPLESASVWKVIADFTAKITILVWICAVKTEEHVLASLL